MKRIKLTQGKTAVVDDDLFDALNQYRWTARKGKKTYYAQRHVVVEGRESTRQMHREIFVLKGVDTPKIVDHRDRNGLNNRWKNLRPATNSQSNQNQGRKINNTSGYIGVSWDKRSQRWHAQANLGGKQKHLGYFDDLEEAAVVRDRFVKRHYGKFAVLNFGAAA